MAATRLMALHINKGKTPAQCLQERTDYASNPEKTEKGELVTAYECDPMTVDEEFLLSKRQYQHITGWHQKNDVIAYQIRQSFRPGEISPEEANRVGYETAKRFTKGKHAFIVATHTDRAHIHNHIIFNSTTLDCKRKFVDFHLSGLALQRVSDIVCVEHGLSVIEKKSYGERTRRDEYPKRQSFREMICGEIDAVLAKKPKDFEAILKLLEAAGYEYKTGKHTAVRGKGQQRFVRFRSLGEGYLEGEIRAVLQGEKAHKARSQKSVHDGQRINLLLEIDEKIQQKGAGYQRWASVYNLKQMAQTMIFLRENGIESMEQLKRNVKDTREKYDKLDGKLKYAEKRLEEISSLKTHIINYSKTRDVYVEYRKSGYSKMYFEEHREAVTLHKAAKNAFSQLRMEKLPRVKDLTAEYAQVLSEKKETYAEFRKARSEMQEYQKVLKNVEMFLQEQGVESVQRKEAAKKGEQRRMAEGKEKRHEER